MKLTHFSLFTGIGGIDLAAEIAGFETVGQCEWADYQTKVLEKHWPDVPRWRDIRDVTAEAVRNRGIRAIDLISGGFPCQPFSLAGLRKGKEDERYLWPEMLRVIQELQPTWVIGENVAGIISMAEQQAFSELESDEVGSTTENMVLEEICQGIEKIGYTVQPFNIPACAVGANHRRERVFIVAYNDRKRQQWNQDSAERYQCNERWKAFSELNSHNNEPRVLANTNKQRCRELELQGQSSEWKMLGGISKERYIIGEQWAVEPGVGRVVNGIPDRVDRLKSLGNAVVPQQVYPILKAVYDIETGSN